MRAQKRNRIRRLGLLFCAGSLFLIAGCQNVQQVTGVQDSRVAEAEENVNGEGFVGEKSYEQNFTKPEIDSNIFVDLKGYTPEDKKQAYFLGENLSDEFYVYDHAEKRLVYTGELKNTGKQTGEGKTVYKGDFSRVTEPGVYYIQTAVIGQSYTFSIDENRYKEQLQELEKEFLNLTPAEYYGYESLQISENSARNVDEAVSPVITDPEERCQVLYSFQKLVTAYAFFGEQLGGDYEKKLEEHAQWLLSERELVLAERTAKETPDYANPGSREQLIVREDYMFASALGAGYVVLQPYNRQLAAQILSQGQKAYQNASGFKFPQTAEMEQEETAVYEELSDMQYMAAASLYRATGSYSYHTVIKNRYTNPETLAAEQSDTGYGIRFWGNLFYMMSQKNVDTEICSRQMKELMNMCGEYSVYSAKNIFGLASEEEEPLECGIWLTMADYTIVSREYRDVCKAQIHYLLYDTETMDLGHEQKSALLLITGNLVEKEATE